MNGIIQCTSAGGGSCGKAIGVGFVGGAAVGALAAGTGGVATGIAGVGFQSAAAGAVVGGAVGGGVGSAGGYASNYLQQKAMGYDPKWDKGDFWKGIGIGAGIGGAMGGLLYGLSDNYALGVDKTVAEWGDRMNMLDRATKAIGYGGDYDVDIAGWYSAWDAKNNSNYNPLTDGVTTGKSNYDPTLRRVTLFNDDFMVKSGNQFKFNAERFLYAAKHETMHYELVEKAISMSINPDVERNLSAEAFQNKYGYPSETMTTDLSRYRYGRYWSTELQKYVNESNVKALKYIEQYNMQQEMNDFRGLFNANY